MQFENMLQRDYNMYKILHIPTAKVVYEEIDYFSYKYSKTIEYFLDKKNMVYIDATKNRYRAQIYFKTKEAAIDYITSYEYYELEDSYIVLYGKATEDTQTKIKLEHFELIHV